MSSCGVVAPTHRAICRYYEQVAALRDQCVLNEMNVRSPFEFLLAETGKVKGWTLIPQLSGKSGGGVTRPDGTLRHTNTLPRGYWEAKDTRDDLAVDLRQLGKHPDCEDTSRFVGEQVCLAP